MDVSWTRTLPGHFFILNLKEFNDNLLKTQRNLKYEEKELEEKLEEHIVQI